MLEDSCDYRFLSVWDRGGWGGFQGRSSPVFCGMPLLVILCIWGSGVGLV